MEKLSEATDGGISATANLWDLLGFPHCPWAGLGSLELSQGMCLLQKLKVLYYGMSMVKNLRMGDGPR